MDITPVRDHFHRTAAEFDSIYSGEKSVLGRMLDRWLRWDMYERFRMTIDECQSIEGKRVLDIGTGSGRFLFPLVERNPEKLVGIDIAPGMIDLAKSLAREQGVESKVEFILGDFQTHQFEQPFHISIAVGVFDYIKVPLPLARKIREVTTEKAIMTFPNRSTIRAPIRKIRLSLRGCPVYFYNLKDVDRLIKDAGFSHYQTRQIGNIFFTVASVQ
jgi:demethylmenaquinone methyltransferase/2-methoxy-6-polyprenyl-1,4-benzoquinol methylase